MKPLRIYLDTSIISSLLAEDAPEKMNLTINMFANMGERAGIEAYASTIVQRELNRTGDDARRKRLLALLADSRIKIVDASRLEPELSELASAYLSEGVLPSGSTEDALHVAIATLLELDVLVSWNYRWS